MLSRRELPEIERGWVHVQLRLWRLLGWPHRQMHGDLRIPPVGVNGDHSGIDLLLQVAGSDERVERILRAVGLQRATALLQRQPGRAVSGRAPGERRAAAIAEQDRCGDAVALWNGAEIERGGIDHQARRLCQQGKWHIRAARAVVLCRVQDVSSRWPAPLRDHVRVKGSRQANREGAVGMVSLQAIQHIRQVRRTRSRMCAWNRARGGQRDRQAIIDGQGNGASWQKPSPVQLQEAANRDGAAAAQRERRGTRQHENDAARSQHHHSGQENDGPLRDDARCRFGGCCDGGVMHMRGVRAVRWSVPVFRAPVPAPPVRFVRRFVRFVMFRRHRMMRRLMVLWMERLMMRRRLMVRHMMCGRLLVFPCPGMLVSHFMGSGGWGLVCQFLWRVACQVRAMGRFRQTAHVGCSSDGWRVAYLRSTPGGWYAAYLRSTRHDRNVCGGSLAEPGAQGSDHIGFDSFICVTFAIQEMPRVQVEGSLCRQCF